MEPIKCKDFPGFFEIPGFAKYCINVFSDIKHKRKNKIIKQYKVHGSNSSDPETGTYLRVTMVNDEGYLSCKAVHRLMATVFKHPGEDVDLADLQVNHKNHRKNDNTPENLEWVSCEKNILHSKTHYRSRSHISVQIKSILTGKVLEFKNIAEGAKFLGIHRTTFISRLHAYKRARVFPGGWMLRYTPSDKDAEWELSSSIEEDIQSFGKTPILAINRLTDEITEFQTLTECAIFFNMSPGTISAFINDLTQPCFMGKNLTVWTVIKKFPKVDFRKVDDPYLELVRRYKSLRLVTAINVETDERRLYETTQDCATDFGIGKTTLNWRLKRENPSSFNGWIFRYYEEALALRNECLH
jgi:hypothetical protein